MKFKRFLVLAAAIAVLMSALAGCQRKEEPEKQEPEIQEEKTVTAECGKMITLQAAEDGYAQIVNDSGMSGTGGRIHLHTNDAACMYKSSEPVFVFDIGHTEKLGLLSLWNYNALEDTASGIKEVRVSLSEDNKAWTEMGTYELARATGENGMKATNLSDGDCIDFEGANGRFLKLEALSNYGGTSFGLSEIRLFRYKQPIKEGHYIAATPLERYIMDNWSAQAEDYGFVNGSGLSDFRSPEATHDNLPEHMFAQKASAIDFIVDLKGEYPLSKLVLWNYNDPEHLDWGLQKFRLKVSDDFNSWRTLGTYTLPMADGSAALQPSLTIDFAEEVRGHYLKLEIMSSYGGEKVGLSEVSAFLGKGWYCDDVPDYTALLSNYSGWTGADGIYTVNLDGKDYDDTRDPAQKKTFFVFSDTIVSSVDPVTKLRSNVTMPNNTCGILTGGAADVTAMQFRFPEKGEATANIVPPTPTPATKEGKFIYYWLGDTFVSGNYLYVYALRVDTVNTMLGFEQNGVDLARYTIVDGNVDFDSLTIVEDTERRLCDASDLGSRYYFGGAVYQSTEEAGVADPDGYVYVYGYNDVQNAGRKLVVSRVLPENIEDFSKYEYLDSDGNWVSKVPSVFRYLADDVAPEVSVTQIQDGEYKGKFLFVNTHITNTPTIMASVSDKPYEVFHDKTIIYVHDTCLTIPGVGNNTYNAKAHPALSGKNEILITYNVNGNDCFKFADIYRPRFLRLAMVESGE